MSRPPSSAVDKALDLIEAVARADRPLRLTELADATGLHRATAYRVLLDLLRRGWVLRTGDRYLPGAAVLQLSRRAAANSLVALCRPVLEALCERTGMMVNLQVLEADRSRVIDVVRPQRLEMITDLLGEGLPVHRFAGPLALVALLPPHERDPYLRLAEEAGHPLSGIEGLLADLLQVERTGFALEHGRNEKPVASVSRAVASADGVPICALTVVGLDAEFAEPRLHQLKQQLQDATAELQDALGGGG
ncbi:IclR family transcriptional regulator [Streptacidiphilus cavernicola]|uniref:IclR family transcriptional regulator n=1 Tax=Streptacidiphilus cavernicola TaxID=3342716 RepID=A0ABV6VWA3_9ACTN